MKKYFKSPMEAKESEAKLVTKILKKVFSKGVEGSKFFYKAEFDYDNGEIAPFLYIGAPAGPWKKFIKDSKKDKDFVAGICKLETLDGNQKLLMKAEMGKGSKALFLKAINKELLRKLSVKAEFVEDLPIQIMDADDEDEEDVGEDDAPEAIADAAASAANISPQEVADNLKAIIEKFKAIKEEHNNEEIDELLDLIADWEDDYKTLSDKYKQALAPSLAKTKEVAAYLQKINQIDSKIDSLFNKIFTLTEFYTKMEDHDSEEANATKEKIEKSIVKVEELAQRINDSDFVDACQDIRATLETI